MSNIHTNIEVKGKIGTVFLEKDEIDRETFKQIEAMIKEDAILNAKIMPDCHKSKNCCVGFTSHLMDKIVPNYVGNDIGCGIVAYPLDLIRPMENWRDKKMEKFTETISLAIAYHTYNHESQCLNFSGDCLNEELDRIFVLSNMEAQKFKEYYFKKFHRDISAKIPTYNRDWLDLFFERTKITINDFFGSLRTLGGGNHFIEFNRSTQNGKEYVSIHTGSRIVGKKICEYHQKKIHTSNTEDEWVEFDKKVLVFNKKNKDKNLRLEYRNQLRDEMKIEKQAKKKYLDEDEAIDYYIDMILGQKFAIVNREMIIKFILNELDSEMLYDPAKKIESIHNYIDFEDFIMRKGAISSHQGKLCLIALNMAEGILLCEGKGNEEWNYSCAHGAGRHITREKARKSRQAIEKRLKKNLEQNGVYSRENPKYIVDEAPECYKDSKLIIDRIEPTIKIIDHLKPFINIKQGMAMAGGL